MQQGKSGAAQFAQRAADAVGVSLGPISLTYGDELAGDSSYDDDGAAPAPSLSTLTTEEWRER